jgi:hypothetical protein
VRTCDYKQVGEVNCIWEIKTIQVPDKRTPDYPDQRRGSRAMTFLAAVRSGSSKRRIPLDEGLLGRRTTLALTVLTKIIEISGAVDSLQMGQVLKVTDFCGDGRAATLYCMRS